MSPFFENNILFKINYLDKCGVLNLAKPILFHSLFHEVDSLIKIGKAGSFSDKTTKLPLSWHFCRSNNHQNDPLRP